MTQIWHKTELNRQAIIDQAHENTLVETLDIKIIEIGDDFIKGTMPVDSRTKQPVACFMEAHQWPLLKRWRALVPTFV